MSDTPPLFDWASEPTEMLAEIGRLRAELVRERNLIERLRQRVDAERGMELRARMQAILREVGIEP